MDDWKTRLYESYVSTGQAANASANSTSLHAGNYPQFLSIIKKHMPRDKAIEIVDLGCGHGSLVYCLHELGYTNASGVDVSPEQVAKARALGIENITEGNLSSFIRTKEDRYDVIFLMDVLEHLGKQAVMDLLLEIHRALKKNGLLIIHVPNAEGIFGMRIRYGDFTHEVCFTPQSMQQILRSNGFSARSISEDTPVIHGVKSLVRSILWHTMTLPTRILLMAETGTKGHILSQNMLVVAKKDDTDYAD